MEHLPIGTVIREARLAAGLSQQVLATQAGIALRTLSRIESGEDMTVGTLSALAAALGLTIPALLTPADIELSADRYESVPAQPEDAA